MAKEVLVRLTTRRESVILDTASNGGTKKQSYENTKMEESVVVGGRLSESSTVISLPVSSSHETFGCTDPGNGILREYQQIKLNKYLVIHGLLSF